jgi:hypothetical protein
MTRNHEKYDYAELAFDRDSALYKALAADAAAIGKPIGQIAMLRLADYYAGRLVTPSIPTQSVQPVVVPAPELASRPAARTVRAPGAPSFQSPAVGKAIEGRTEDEGELELDEEQARDNIAAFLSGQNDLLS